MAKIFNPTKSPFGVRLPGNVKAFIRPGATVEIDLDQDQLAKLERRGCVVSETYTPFSDTFAHEFIADINRLQNSNPDPIATAMVDQLASLSDDELRAMAKAKGLNLHHKTGRAKLIEALGV